MVERFLALERQSRVFQIRLRLGDLVLGRCQIGFALPDEIARLRLLVLQIRPSLRHLGGGLSGAVGVESQVGLLFGRLNDGEQLAIGHDVSLADQEALQPALNFRTDNHLIGRDHACQYEFIPATHGQKINDRGNDDRGHNDQRKLSLHNLRQFGRIAASRQFLPGQTNPSGGGVFGKFPIAQDYFHARLFDFA